MIPLELRKIHLLCSHPCKRVKSYDSRGAPTVVCWQNRTQLADIILVDKLIMLDVTYMYSFRMSSNSPSIAWSFSFSFIVSRELFFLTNKNKILRIDRWSLVYDLDLRCINGSEEPMSNKNDSYTIRDCFYQWFPCCETIFYAFNCIFTGNHQIDVDRMWSSKYPSKPTWADLFLGPMSGFSRWSAVFKVSYQFVRSDFS